MFNRRSALAAVFAGSLAGALVGAVPARGADQQDDLWDRSTLTGNWDGLRDRLKDQGVTVNLEYTGELLANVRGGIRTGAVYEGLLLAEVNADLAKLLGWSGAALHVSAFDFHGRGLTQGYVGSILTVSGNEAPAPSVRLWEAYLDQTAFGGTVSFRLGQFALDEDGFFVTKIANLFVGSTFGGLPDGIGANLPGGASTYPLSAPGVRVRLRPAAGLELAAALQSGDPAGGDGTTLPPETVPTGTVFSFSGGTMGIVQATLQRNQDKHAPGLPMIFKLGAWYHSGRHFGDQLLAANLVPQTAPDAASTPLQHHGDWGVFGSAETMLYRVPGTDDQGISAFVLLAGSPPDQNLIDRYAHAGLVGKGLIPGRGDDGAGIAVAYAHVSPRAQALDRDAQMLDPTMPVRDYEYLIEATYRAQVTPWLIAQPVVQFWFHPGGNVDNDNGTQRRNAVVIGLRSSVTF